MKNRLEQIGNLEANPRGRSEIDHEKLAEISKLLPSKKAFEKETSLKRSFHQPKDEID